ncbi:DUF3347 domain-containing protein [Flavobacteriaceae bacterium TK19130]|nr:DUF3347 domain-containing protein [Thermobacterium salinum]
MKKIVALLVLIALVLTSCADDKKKQDVAEEETTTEIEKNPQQLDQINFNDDGMRKIFASYIDVKSALVETDAEKAKAAASNLMTDFANVGVEPAAMKAAQSIKEADDVEVQRTAFMILTNEVEKMMMDALDGGVIYKQYCPMAFDNKGAYWLSESEEIRNPYFGDKMLKCGKVTSQIH